MSFYDEPHFVNLRPTPPFTRYLAAEESFVRASIAGGYTLDVGCGTGRSTRLLASFVDRVIGIDKSDYLLSKAKEEHPDLEFSLQDAAKLCFDDGLFDNVVMLWNMFGNVACERDVVLQEARRVLKADGTMYLSVLSKNALIAYAYMLRENDLTLDFFDDNYVILKEGLVSERFTEEKLHNLFEKYQLKAIIRELTSIGYWCEVNKS